MIKLDEPYTALRQPPGQQTIGRVSAGVAHVVAVLLQDRLRLAGEVDYLGNRLLHRKSQLVLRNAFFEDTVRRAFELKPVQFAEPIEHLAAAGVVDAVRITEIQYRVFAGTEPDALVFGRQKTASPQAIVQGLPAAPGPAKCTPEI